MRSPKLVAALVVALTPLLMAERCGPATSLLPAWVPGGLVADDALVGAYVTVSQQSGDDKPAAAPPAKITRDDTEDGPSYALLLGGEPALKDVRLRLFVFDLGGVRFVDMIAEDASKSGEFAKGLALPQHMIFKLTHPPGGGVSLDYLDAKWVDAEVAKDPKGLTTVAPPRAFRTNDVGQRQSDRSPVLSGDAKVLQALLARAAAVPEAWSFGIELVKKGAPVHRFTFTEEYSEMSRDAHGTKATFTVIGSRITMESTSWGRTSDPSLPTDKKVGVIADPEKIDALVRAVQKAPKTRPKQPIPPTDRRTAQLCLRLPGSAPRCAERLPDDDSGADLAALKALRTALTQEPGSLR